MSGWADCALCAGEGRAARIDEANELVEIVACPVCLERDRRLFGVCFVHDGYRVAPSRVTVHADERHGARYQELGVTRMAPLASTAANYEGLLGWLREHRPGHSSDTEPSDA